MTSRAISGVFEGLPPVIPSRMPELRSAPVRRAAHRPRLDLRGESFGMLVAIEVVGLSSDGEVLWLCRCVCGVQKPVRRGHLRMGRAKSCGCQRLAPAKPWWCW